MALGKIELIFAVGLTFGVTCLPALATDVVAPDTAQADMQFTAGHFDDALKLYETILATSPNYEPALRRQGAIALYENRLADAGRLLNLALAQNPADTKAQSLLAEAASRRGDFAQTAAWLVKAGKPERAALFAAFGKAKPYRIVSKTKSARIPFVETDPLPAVTAKVNGAEGLFLIDTGGAEVVIDPKFASSKGVAAIGGGEGTFAGGKTAGITYGRIMKFEIGALQIADIPAMLLSTKGFSATANGKPVAGVIGTAFLSRFLATIDYPAGALILEPRSAPPHADFLNAIPFWLVGDHYVVAQGKLDAGSEQLFLIDSGLAGFAFTAPASTLHDAGIAIPAPPTAAASSEVGQSSATPFAIDSLSLGELQAKNVSGLFGPFPPQIENSLGVHLGGIVSHAFFRPYAVTFDFVHMKLYVRRPPA
jgi:predicted aspartyl protease